MFALKIAEHCGLFQSQTSPLVFILAMEVRWSDDAIWGFKAKKRNLA